MSNPWIVDPTDAGSSKKLDVTYVDADGTARPIWVTVRTELNEGEHRKMLKSISRVSQPVGVEDSKAEATLEWTDYSFARMVAYVIDWSLAHEAEPSHRLPVGRASFEKLRRPVFEAIDAVLDAHEKAAASASKPTARGGRRPRAIAN